MASTHPLPAICFATPRSRDISGQIAPPYDMLNAKSKSALVARNENNICVIDLPHLPAKTLGPDSIYCNAGRTFHRWLNDGLLVRRQKPAVFVYRMAFVTPGTGQKSLQRLGLIVNVEFPNASEQSAKSNIHLHEKTFRAAREDRLKLMQATASQMSPIFGIYSDPELLINQQLATLIDSVNPDFFGQTPDKTQHEIWAVDDPSAIEPLTAALKDKDIYIADGHHRFATALEYRRLLSAPVGELPADHPSNNCMFGLTAMQDPGMMMLPTHRVLGRTENLTVNHLAEAIGNNDHWTVIVRAGDDRPLADIAANLKSAGHHAIGLYDAASAQTLVIATRTADPLADLMPNRPAVWRTLDVVVLHELLLDQVLRPAFGGQSVIIHYTADLGDLRHMTATEPGRLGIILQPTPLDAVRRVSEVGELMPQKSTFFYPKLATGLVIHALDQAPQPQVIGHGAAPDHRFEA